MNLRPHDVDSHRLEPGRLWSLLDVINSSISTLGGVYSFLIYKQLIGDRHGASPVSPDDITEINGWLSLVAGVADDFDMKGVHHRISLITKLLEGGTTNDRLSNELRVLRETITHESKDHFIYRYPTDKSKLIVEWKTTWKSTMDAFPSAIPDIYAGVDLWGLQHSTASVFHFMRVLEHGIRALAVDLGLVFDLQNWQNILDQIESEVRAQSKALPRGSVKSDRLQFLSEAAKEFHFFKDGWRNHVSHNRAAYDGHQARSVMDHVCSFMNVLSTRLKE